MLFSDACTRWISLLLWRSSQFQNGWCLLPSFMKYEYLTWQTFDISSWNLSDTVLLFTDCWLCVWASSDVPHTVWTSPAASLNLIQQILNVCVWSWSSWTSTYSLWESVQTPAAFSTAELRSFTHIAWCSRFISVNRNIIKRLLLFLFFYPVNRFICRYTAYIELLIYFHVDDYNFLRRWVWGFY